MIYDVAIVGGGPAGSACAVVCAAAGMRTVLLEKAIFPREKVCGDCLNPGCWPILDRLGVSAQIQTLPHAPLHGVEFIGLHGHGLAVPFAGPGRGEIAIKRSLFDHALMSRAAECGVEVRQGEAVTTVEPGWSVRTTRGSFRAEVLIAADGRNSTVARLLGLMPAAARDRVGLQAHVALPDGTGVPDRVTLRILPRGYCGIAPVGAGEMNVCLVSRPRYLEELKAWAHAEFSLPASHSWRSITPLSRAPVPPAHERLMLIGDVARVVEPFTGEGILYALASAELAAGHVAAGTLPAYAESHAALYRGRLWINELARVAVLHPRLGSALLEVARFAPGLLRMLTARVVGPAASPSLTAGPRVSARERASR